MEYVQKELWCKRGENNIFGMAFLPGESAECCAGKKYPLVIFSHELCHTHESGAPYAERLVQEGYAVYLYDFCGGSVDSKSDGTTYDMTLMTNVEDLDAVLDAARTWDFVDADRITLFGGSQGGVAAAIVAARREKDVHNLVLMYPAFVMTDAIHRLFPDKDSIPEKIRIYNWIDVRREYALATYDYDVRSEIDGYTGPVLLLHGELDSTVPPSYSEEAAGIYRNAKLYMITNGKHGFRREAFEEACGYILDFLKQN